MQPAALLVLLGLLPLILTACDEPGSTPEPEAPPPASMPPPSGEHESAAASTPPREPAPPTCTGKPGKPGDEEITIVSSGLEREATIHVPPLHDGVKALPLVLVLHPLLLTRKNMRNLVKVERFADDAEHGFVALFPDGVGRSWNAGECCGDAKEKKLDDVGFIRDLIEHVSQRWCIDRARVYSMGFSNGAFLSHRLACELPGGVRAIAPVAGTLGIPASTCKPAHPTPVLAIHGTDDDLVPYEGGPPKIPHGASFGTFISPGATDSFWAETNGCKGAPSTYFTRGEVSCVRHEQCRDQATVALCTVNGGGHQWPGADPLPAMGHLTKDIDATEAAIELFRAHGL
jgi:polyhydroxybutyrate depolymerase